MVARNPYTLTFGREPAESIPRFLQSREIVDAFTQDPPSQQVYMITGVRGMGKTVFMTEVAQRIGSRDGWIVVELNPEKDMLEGLASKLSSENELAKIFQSASINLSFFGFGLQVKGVAPITDIETALQKMISSLKKSGRRLLVTIDEATSSEQMRVFAAAFQIFVRQNLPIYLLMTGLYENINALRNEKSLTFLYRAPRIELGPLNIGAIASNYASTFGLDDTAALKMARLTEGYSFAFQVLGHFTWENGGDFETATGVSRQYLDEYAYDKIWSELSAGDQQVLSAIARSGSGRVAEVREILNWDTNNFNPYRQRLIRRGLVDGTTRGYVRLTLPFFAQYIAEHYTGGED